MSNSQTSYTITLSLLGIAVLASIVLWSMLSQPTPPESRPTPRISQKTPQPIPPVMRVTSPPSSQLPPEKIDPIVQRGLGAQVTGVKAHRARRVVELPKDLSLGEQVITLRGGEWQLRVTISLSSEDSGFVRYAGPLRGKLIEMLYFLVSHRVPESLRTPSGEERLRTDLHTRYSNLLRNQTFEIYFDSLSLEAKELSDEEREDESEW